MTLVPVSTAARTIDSTLEKSKLVRRLFDQVPAQSFAHRADHVAEGGDNL